MFDIIRKTPQEDAKNSISIRVGLLLYFTQKTGKELEKEDDPAAGESKASRHMWTQNQGNQTEVRGQARFVFPASCPQRTSRLLLDGPTKILHMQLTHHSVFYLLLNEFKSVVFVRLLSMVPALEACGLVWVYGPLQRSL